MWSGPARLPLAQSASSEEFKDASLQKLVKTWGRTALTAASKAQAERLRLAKSEGQNRRDRREIESMRASVREMTREAEAFRSYMAAKEAMKMKHGKNESDALQFGHDLAHRLRLARKEDQSKDV